MKNLIKINIRIGWILIVGIIISQLFITKTTYDIGRMAPFYALLTLILFIPFMMTAIASTLNRIEKIKRIKIAIIIGVTCQIVLPTILPLIFDKELITLSLAGLTLAIIMFFFRKKIEIQLFILNGIGVIVLSFISALVLMNF